MVSLNAPSAAFPQRRPDRGLCVLSVLCALLLAWIILPPANAGQLNLDERLDLALQNASLPVVLQSMAQILGAELHMDETIDGKVTIEAQAEPWQDILDDLCRTHGLSCEVIPDQPPVLRVRSVDSDPGYHSEPGLVQLLDVALQGALLRDTLEVLAQMADRPIDIHPEVDGRVSLALRRAPWFLALQTVCEINHCRVLWQDPIRVVPLGEGESNPRFRLALQQAERSKALQTAVTLPSFSPWGTIRVDVAPAVSGTVDVHLEAASSVDILDALCRAPDCRWQLIYGAPSVLRIQPGSIDDAGPMAVYRPRGQDPVTLRVSSRQASPGIEWTDARATDAATSAIRQVDFTWSTPRHAMALGEDEELVLSWLPLQTESGVLLPMVRHCHLGEGILLAPIVLPLSGATERRHGDTVLRFESGNAAEAASRQPPAVTESPCLDAAPQNGRLVITLDGSATDGAGTATEHTVPAVAGSYLLVQGAGGHSGQGAVVVLPGPAGGLHWMWVNMEDGKVATRSSRLSPGLPHTVTLDDDMSLTLRYDDTGLI